MGAVGRILLIVVVVVLGIAVGGYFLLPPKASRSQTIVVDRPAAAVFGFLSNAPSGAQLANGITETKVISAQANQVVSAVKFADGSTGTATFLVTPQGDKSQVQMTLEQPLGPNPLSRIDAVTGGKITPLFDAAAAEVKKDLNALPPGNPAGLAYELVQVNAKPFLYNENCSSQDASSIKDAVAQSLDALRPLLSQLGIRQDGPPVAVETKWDDAAKQYCFQIGFTYAGSAHKSYIAKLGQTPGGSAIMVHYTGPEDKIIPTYDQMEALAAAARLQLGLSFEVYNDDPTASPAGSTDRNIYYLVSGDTSALARVAPPVAALAAAPAATTPAGSSTPASSTPAALPAASSSAPASGAPGASPTSSTPLSIGPPSSAAPAPAP